AERVRGSSPGRGRWPGARAAEPIGGLGSSIRACTKASSWLSCSARCFWYRTASSGLKWMPSSLATATTSSTCGTVYIACLLSYPRLGRRGPSPATACGAHCSYPRLGRRAPAPRRPAVRTACCAEARSERRTPQHPWIDLAGHELTVAGRAQQLAVRDHDFAAQYHRHRPALDLPAFPGAIVPHVQVSHAQRLLDRRIDDGDVGVAAHRDGTLLGVEAQELRRMGR